MTFPGPAPASAAEPHVDAWVEVKDLLPLDAYGRARGELIVRTSGNGQIAVPVDVYDGDPAAGGKKAASFEHLLQAGASARYSVSWRGTPGEHTLVVVVYSANAVRETDEQNNIATAKVTFVDDSWAREVARSRCQ